jgi:hypothetical protein
LLRECSRSAFFTAIPAVQAMMAIFMNSDGWMLIPTFSQRRAPLMRGAMDSVPGITTTTSISVSTQSIGQASRRQRR